MRNAQGMSAALPLLRVGATKSPANEAFEGKTLMEIAAAEGRDIGEIILDLSLADDLQTEFQLKGVLNADSQAVAGEEDAVAVSTWHRAKGLEWPIVVLFGLERLREQSRVVENGADGTISSLFVGMVFGCLWGKAEPHRT